MSDGRQIRGVLAANIRKVRELRGWTQDEYARLAGVSRPRISEIEREAASTSIDIIEKLANAAGVTVSALLTDGDFLPLSIIAEHLQKFEIPRFIFGKTKKPPFGGVCRSAFHPTMLIWELRGK